MFAAAACLLVNDALPAAAQAPPGAGRAFQLAVLQDAAVQADPRFRQPQ
jgi:hypothetical protein